MKWLWEAVGTMPSTNVRIVVSLLLAIGTGVRVVALGWEPPGEWLAFLAAMAAIDAGQFIGKRVTQSSPPAPPEAGA